MGNHPPFENNRKFLITERSLNYILRPVHVRTASYPYTYSVRNLDEMVSVTVDRAWTPHNHLVLDFIGNKLYSKAYRHINKRRNDWENVRSRQFLMNAEKILRYSDRGNLIKDHLRPLLPKYKKFCHLTESCSELEKLNHRQKLSEEDVEKFNKMDLEKSMLQRELQIYLVELDSVRDLVFENALGSVEMKFEISEVLQHYDSFFRKRRREYFKDLLIKTSEVRFSLIYPIRVPIIQNEVKNGEPQPVIKDVDLRKIKIENDKFFNIEFEKDTITILFNTFLGLAYVHNLLTLNTDWFEKEFMNIDGYASAIYRRFFVIRPGNNCDRISIKEVVEYFNFMKNSHYPAIIERAFEDIKIAGLIRDYRIVRSGGKFSKGHIEIEKSSK